MNSIERVLEFDVDMQRITKNRDCDFSHIVAGSVGYLKAKFNFSDSQWKACKKAASFWLNGEESAVLLDESDMCPIPSEVLVGKKFYVSLTIAHNGIQFTTNQTKRRRQCKRT